jgi:succinyl-diaminopimelate desuccinylase
MNLLELTKQLISFDSITPLSNGCIEYIDALLKSYGFQTYIVKFGSSSHEVTNLYAVFGDHGPNICFAGHIDVVPTGPLDQWIYPPFKATVRDDKLYGRGAVDMKAAIGAMIIASRNFIQNNSAQSGRISFLLTSDEEGAALYGIKPMINWLKENGHQIDFCILGEPTYQKAFGDVVQIGRRGSASFLLDIIGTQGHVAYDNFDNPNAIAIKIGSELMSLKLDDGNDLFVASELNITSIDTGNYVTNIVPYKTTIRFNIRYNNLWNPQDLQEKCHGIIAKFSSNFQLSLVEKPSVPFLSDINNKHVQKFCKVVFDAIGLRPEFTTYGGASDGRFIINMCQVIEFGLASKTAHQINEHLFLQDLENLSRIYEDFLLQFFIVD